MRKHYNKRYFEDRDRLDLLIAHVLKAFLKEKKLKKILDVGCGTGKLVNFLNQHSFQTIGCDNQAEAIKIARSTNKKGSIIKASAEKLPFNNQSFNLITAISVIEHLAPKQAQKFIQESFRVLKPSGYIFLITPNFNSPLRLILKEKWFGFSDPTHINFFTPKSLNYLLQKSGFINVKTRFKPVYNLDFDLYLPKFLCNLPKPLKNLATYLMISSPLATYRDSFWMIAQKR